MRKIQVRLIYNFWSSLSFTSSILEKLFQLSQYFEILLDYMLSCCFTIISNYFDRYFLPLSLLGYSEMVFELITFKHLRYHFTCHLSCKYSQKRTYQFKMQMNQKMKGKRCRLNKPMYTYSYKGVRVKHGIAKCPNNGSVEVS